MLSPHLLLVPLNQNCAALPMWFLEKTLRLSFKLKLLPLNFNYDPSLYEFKQKLGTEFGNSYFRDQPKFLCSFKLSFCCPKRRSSSSEETLFGLNFRAVFPAKISCDLNSQIVLLLQRPNLRQIKICLSKKIVECRRYGYSAEHLELSGSTPVAQHLFGLIIDIEEISRCL